MATDRRNPWKTRAPRVLQRPLGASGLHALLRDPALLAHADSSPALDLAYAVRRLARHPVTLERAQALAARITLPAERLAAEGTLELARGEPAAAERTLRRALALDPHHAAARAALLRRFAEAVRRGVRVEAAEGEIGWEAGSVVSSWRALAGGDRAALAALDERLAAIPPRHPLATDAMRARVEAGLLLGGAARETLALAGALAAREPTAAHHLLRARAALALDQPWAAAASLAEAAALIALAPDGHDAAEARAIRRTFESRFPNLARTLFAQRT